MKKIRVVFAIIQSYAALSLFGGVFTNQVVGTSAVYELDNWDQGSSWIGGAAPGWADGDSICLPMTLCGAYQKVILPKTEETNYAYGSFSGGASTCLCFKPRSGTSLTVADPAAYCGTWRFAGPVQFVVGGGSETIPVVQKLNPTGGVKIDAQTAKAARVIVSNLVGSASFAKAGDAMLEVGATAGAFTSVAVREGAMKVLAREPDNAAALEAALAKANLHFDASDPATVTAPDGRVTELRDVRNNGYVATVITLRRDGKTPFGFKVPGPLLVKDVQSGRVVLDFGPRTDTATDSPEDVLTSRGSAALSFPRFSQVREVFVVAADHDAAGPFMSFSPDTHQLDLIRGNMGEIFNSAYGTVRVAEGSFAAGCFRGGDIRVNGAKVPCDFNVAGTDMKVISYGALPYPAKDGDASCFAPVAGFCNFLDVQFGGLRIGEYIGFSVELTDRERTLICRHLNEKWGTASDGEYAFDTVMTASGSAIVTSDGADTRVRIVRPEDGVLVKKGEGRLLVDSSAGSVGVRIKGGCIGFTGALKPSVSPSVAPDPYCHFDASLESSLHVADAKVERWNDVRGSEYGSALPVTAADCHYSSQSYGAPMIVADALNGKAVVSLGSKTNGDRDHSGSAGLKFVHENINQANVRAGFLVIKKSTVDTFMLGGYSSYAFHAPSTETLFNATFAATGVVGGKWTVNGVPCDATAEACLPCNVFKLVAFETTEKVVAETLGADRIVSGPNAFGGLQIAEVILYDRPLTPQERVDTEAYLLDKWFASAHPFAVGGIAAVEGTGSEGYVKTGSGTDTVGSLLGVASVDVEGGTLVSANDCVHTMAKAVIHLDASAEGTVDVVEDQDFGNIVTEWRDVRPGAKYKALPYGAEIGCKPPLYRTDATAYGIVPGKPTISCRNITFTQVLEPIQDSSAFYFADSSGSIQRLTTIREGVVVMRAPALNFLLGDTGTYHFHRCNTGELLVPGGTSSESLRLNAVWRKDAEEVDPCVWNPSAEGNVSPYFVVGFAITNAASASVAVSQLARDREGRRGGIEYAEILLFDTALNDLERKAMQAALMKKWLGKDYPGSDSVRAVNVAKGAVADFGSQSLALTSFTGYGTLKAGGVTGISTLDVSWRSTGDYDYRTVIGAMTLASSGTVNLTVKGVERPRAESIVVLDASAVSNPEVLSNWAVTLSPAKYASHYSTKLRYVNGKVVLDLTPHGLLLIVQ